MFSCKRHGGSVLVVWERPPGPHRLSDEECPFCRSMVVLKERIIWGDKGVESRIKQLEAEIEDLKKSGSIGPFQAS